MLSKARAVATAIATSNATADRYCYCSYHDDKLTGFCIATTIAILSLLLLVLLTTTVACYDY